MLISNHSNLDIFSVPVYTTTENAGRQLHGFLHLILNISTIFAHRR